MLPKRALDIARDAGASEIDLADNEVQSLPDLVRNVDRSGFGIAANAAAAEVLQHTGAEFESFAHLLADKVFPLRVRYASL